MTDLFFWIAFIFEVFYISMFLLTIKSLEFRFWPPPSARSWQFFVSWIVAALVAVLYLFLGFLDFASFILPDFWDRFPIALVFLTAGGMLGTWASLSFPFRTTIGLGKRLITKGPYRYSRNPQYLGDSLLIIGYFFLANSWRVGVISFVGVALNILAVFTEEPWLEERFGDAYREYERRVHRFIGRRKVDAA
jgi:protein-S-isoprenylcysteine O-methyltransferase Ste14